MGIGAPFGMSAYPRHHSRVELYLAKRSHPVSWIPGNSGLWSSLEIQCYFLWMAGSSPSEPPPGPRGAMADCPPHFPSPDANDLSHSALFSAARGLRLGVSERIYQDRVGSEAVGRKPNHPLPGEAASCSEHSPSPGCDPSPPSQDLPGTGSLCRWSPFPPFQPSRQLPPDSPSPACGYHSLVTAPLDGDRSQQSHRWRENAENLRLYI